MRMFQRAAGTKRWHVVLALIILTGLILPSHGCSKPRLGDPYRRLDAIPPGKAVVYLYRPFADFPSIYNERVGIIVEGKEIVGLPGGAYYPYVTGTGEITFATNFGISSSDAVTIDAREGRSYFIKVGLRAGVVRSHAVITIVPNEIAELQIGALNILQDEPTT